MYIYLYIYILNLVDSKVKSRLFLHHGSNITLKIVIGRKVNDILLFQMVDKHNVVIRLVEEFISTNSY